MERNFTLTRAQLQQELDSCLYCAEKPCQKACPVNCSPADFIMAAKLLQPQDIERSGKIILSANPLGSLCGITCPDSFCMKACSKAKLDKPLFIPKIQASLMSLFHEKERVENKIFPKDKGKVAVVGAGPAGLAASCVLREHGFEVDLFDEKEYGGACNLIPQTRLPYEFLKKDYEFALSYYGISFIQKKITKSEELNSYLGCILAIGQKEDILPQIEGKEYLIEASSFLQKDRAGEKIAIIGGGAVAIDCLEHARNLKAKHVDLMVRRRSCDLKLTQEEYKSLYELEGNVLSLKAPYKIEKEKGKYHFYLKNTFIENNKATIIEDEISLYKNYDLIVSAIGFENKNKEHFHKNVFWAGDALHGGSTVVEAVASGKNAALKLVASLEKKTFQEISSPFSKAKSTFIHHSFIQEPVSLKTSFFHLSLENPFLLSAAPHTDSLEAVELALEAGWAGVILKTAFDGLPIHVPESYMFKYQESTFANSDNVSERKLDEVCQDIQILRKKYPHKLIMGSTGGSVTGNDAEDAKVWVKNTQKLEKAGAMAIEYSLSCPQGGDGTHGSIVSQNAKLSAKIIEWVISQTNPQIPKLFKLTGAVTSIVPILQEIKKVYEKYPHSYAGITLANSFPTLAFRGEEGIVAGMSGEGVLPISYLTLAGASSLKMNISGNGGVMDYLSAARFLALGCETVQCCSLPMKYGVFIVEELISGLSYYLKEKKLSCINDLVGRYQKNPITAFENLSPVKKIPQVDDSLCASCGNCTHCGHRAVTLKEGKPVFDPQKCVGCSFCAQMCFTGALLMIERKSS